MVNEKLINIKDDKVIILDSEVKEKLLNSYSSYKKTMLYLSCDAPIETLHLSKVIETILLDNGIIRIYDLLDMDLTKIKGLGESRIRNITTSLNKFLAIF